MHQSIVIIPTYNEIENIDSIIRAVMALGDSEFDVLVVDDGAPDGTPGAVRALQQEFPGRIKLHERPGKLGLGTAYIEGFKICLADPAGYRYIFEMDADFSHDPKDLLRLLSACRDEGADMAVGSRYVTGVNVVNWPIGRVLMSYYASAYVRLVTGMPVHDTTAGFACYTRRVLEALPLDSIRCKGYAFQIEMKFQTFKRGFRIKEVPIVFVNRVLGTSKMSTGIFSEAVFGVLRLRLDSMFKKYPQYGPQTDTDS